MHERQWVAPATKTCICNFPIMPGGLCFSRLKVDLARVLICTSKAQLCPLRGSRARSNHHFAETQLPGTLNRSSGCVPADGGCRVVPAAVKLENPIGQFPSVGDLPFPESGRGFFSSPEMPPQTNVLQEWPNCRSGELRTRFCEPVPVRLNPRLPGATLERRA